MSRIHKALKRAELEHGSMLPPAVPALPTDPLLTGSGRPLVPAHMTERSVGSATKLRFEDVIARCAHPEWRLDPKLNIFLNSSPNAHATEQLRILRSRLYQIRKQQPLKIILITSSVAGEGKSFVAGNLAQAIIRQNQRYVLLVDADLRCPQQHLSLQAPVKPGLSDYLRGDEDEMAVIQHGQEGNLCFIAAGQSVANPNELLLTGRLKGLLENIAPAFDWIIIDSPPCLALADARVIADLCDGIIFVLKAASTDLEVAQRAQQTFPTQKILGVVLNRVEKGASYPSSYYYQSKGAAKSDP